MKKTINVNNFAFEVIKPRKNKATFESAKRTKGRTLSNYYKSVSATKENIFLMWKNWAIDTDSHGKADIMDFGVSSANSMQFTLAFNMQYNGQWYSCKITREHNYAYVIE